jgi:ubiquinone/menaquinone biosynthesis C-methylase UbiE
MSMAAYHKDDIAQRFAERKQAERYRDRFRKGRRRRTHAREWRALNSLLESLGEARTILDVGSGPGRFVRLFADYADRVVQTDYSQHMLAISREDYPLEGGRGGWVQADARSLPFREASADLVFCHRLLNHIPQAAGRKRILQNLATVSRRYVVVSCLTPPVPLRLIRRAYKALGKRESIDGDVEIDDLLADASAAGLRLQDRTRIRSFPVVGEFLIFERG